MATTPEAKVKKVVVRQLKLLGAYYFYPVTGGYGIAVVVNEKNMNDIEDILWGAEKEFEFN